MRELLPDRVGQVAILRGLICGIELGVFFIIVSHMMLMFIHIRWRKVRVLGGGFIYGYIQITDFNLVILRPLLV